jgi:hypothetical protein
VRWRRAGHAQVVNYLNNPFYAGAYVYGRRGTRTKVVDGQARKTTGHMKPLEQWDVLIPENHRGYISWADFLRNRAILADNTHMMKRIEAKAARGGHGLLAGMLRCARCTRKIGVYYQGDGVHRYRCRSDRSNSGAERCIEFGGKVADAAISEVVLKVVRGPAIEAALEAADRGRGDEQQVCVLAAT